MLILLLILVTDIEAVLVLLLISWKESTIKLLLGLFLLTEGCLITYTYGKLFTFSIISDCC